MELRSNKLMWFLLFISRLFVGRDFLIGNEVIIAHNVDCVHSDRVSSPLPFCFYDWITFIVIPWQSVCKLTIAIRYTHYSRDIERENFTVDSRWFETNSNFEFSFAYIFCAIDFNFYFINFVANSTESCFHSGLLRVKWIATSLAPLEPNHCGSIVLTLFVECVCARARFQVLTCICL